MLLRVSVVRKGGLSLCRSRTPRGLDDELDTGDAKFFQVIEQLNSQKYGKQKRAGRAGGPGLTW